MAVDLIARALALKAAGGSGSSGFAKEADFNAPGFMPEENTYYIYKDSGVEPVIEYKPFVVGEILPSGSLIHIHPDKQDELAAFIDGLTDGQAGFFVVLGTKPNGGIVFQHLSAGEGVTADANILVYTDIVSQKLTPIYSSAETDFNESGVQVHITKGFQNLDSNNNFVLDYGDDEWGITMLSYGPDPTIFDNLDWNGKMISWAEPQAGSKYQDGVLYLYQDGAMHEIGQQGEGDDAPILNADFYAKDFKPQNGRFYRQVGTSKKIGPIEHEQGSRNLTLYFDMSMPIEDMVYALEGLERDEVPPMSETEGLKMWAMVGDKDGGSFSSISILHVPANAEGMACDKDFWQIGIFGGLFSLWNSETYQMQVEQSKPSQTVVKGWHESMSGQTFIVDGKMVMSGADYYVFNTQYWNAFTSTEPIKEAAKNTIAKYHDGSYDEVALKSDVPEITIDTTLDSDSDNPIANSAVTRAIQNLPTRSLEYYTIFGEYGDALVRSKLVNFIKWAADNHTVQLTYLQIGSNNISFTSIDGSHNATVSGFYMHNPHYSSFDTLNQYYIMNDYLCVYNDAVPYYLYIDRSNNDAFITKSNTFDSSDPTTFSRVTDWHAAYYSFSEYNPN